MGGLHILAEIDRRPWTVRPPGLNAVRARIGQVMVDIAAL